MANAAPAANGNGNGHHNYMELQKELRFSGDQPVPKGEVSAQEFLRRIETTSKTPVVLSEQQTMDRVVACLVGGAADWFHNGLMATLPSKAMRTQIRSGYTTHFKAVFKKEWHVQELQASARAADISHQKHGESTDNYLRRIAGAIFKYDFIKDEPLFGEAIPPISQTLLDDISAAQRLELADREAMLKERYMESAHHGLATAMVKSIVHEGLSEREMKTEAWKHMEHTMPMNDFFDVLREAQIRIDRNRPGGGNGNHNNHNGRNKKVHAVEENADAVATTTDDKDFPSSFSADEVAAVKKLRAAKGSKSSNTGKGKAPKTGNGGNFVKNGATCSYCYRVGHELNNCFRRNGDRDSGVFRDNIKASFKAKSVGAELASSISTGVNSVNLGNQSRGKASGNAGGT